MTIKKFQFAVILFLFLFLISNSFAGKGYRNSRLGVVQDYYDPIDKKFLAIVERAHIVEMEERYKNKGNWKWVWDDLEYTLEHVPNHPLALLKMISFVREYEKKSIKDADAWFEKAIKWNQLEPNTRVLYGIHLYKSDRWNKAAEQYRVAIQLDPKHIEAHYNFGLLLVKLGKLNEANEHAKIAYNAGYPLQGLKRILAKASN